MRLLATVFFALVLLTIESVLVQAFGWKITRVDVTVVLIAFLALRASTLEGAFAAFFIGYMLDSMSGGPTWLYTFLGVFTFLLARLGGSLVDVRTPIAFAAYCVGVDALHGVLAIFFTWLASKQGGGAGVLFSALPLQVFLTGIAALLLYPLLRRVDPGSDRPEVGALR